MAIVVAPVVLIALGFALWRRRKAYKAFTSDCEFLVFQNISSKCFFPSLCSSQTVTISVLQIDFGRLIMVKDYGTESEMYLV